MTQLANKNLLVVQSNELIEAHYKQEYTIQEQRCVLFIISKIRQEDRELIEKNLQKEIKISAKDFAQIMGVSVSQVYRDAKKIGDALMQKVLKIQETEDEWLLVHWVSSMRYKQGNITLKISPEIIPHLIVFKKTYTSFRLENILFLNSAHAIKIYQLLTQYKRLGERKITLHYLRSLLGIQDVKSYATFSALKRRILDISQREINAKTDILFSYTAEKEGRKIEAIKFKITSKPKKEGKTISLEKKVELQKEAKKCYITNHKGHCASSWETHTHNILHACHYCKKFASQRNEQPDNEQ